MSEFMQYACIFICLGAFFLGVALGRSSQREEDERKFGFRDAFGNIAGPYRRNEDEDGDADPPNIP